MGADERHLMGQLSHAKSTMARGRFGDALEILDPLMSQYPDDPEAIYLTAYCFIELDEMTSAHDLATRLVRKYKYEPGQDLLNTINENDPLPTIETTSGSSFSCGRFLFLGCLALVLFPVVISLIGIIVLDNKFTLLFPDDAVSLVEQYGENHAVVLVVRTEGEIFEEHVASAMDWPPWTVEAVIPHEFGFFLDASPEHNQFTMTIAASTKRLGGFFDWSLGNTPLYEIKFGDGMETVFADVDDRGVLQFDTVGQLSEIGRQQLSEGFALEPLGFQQFKGGIPVEIRFNNDDGAAFLIMDTLFGKGNLPNPPPIDDAWRAVFLNAYSGSILIDNVIAEKFSLTIQVECVDSKLAESVLTALKEIERLGSEEYAHLAVNGEIIRDGKMVEGRFAIGNYESTLEKLVRSSAGWAEANQ